jgi:hypothetical protein
MNPSPRTLEQVKESVANARKAGSADQFISLLIKYGNVTPEAYRYLETFRKECPRCGLLNGHRYPCAS